MLLMSCSGIKFSKVPTNDLERHRIRSPINPSKLLALVGVPLKDRVSTWARKPTTKLSASVSLGHCNQ